MKIMAYEDDILQLIPHEELPELRDMYKDHMPFATYVFSFFNIALKWLRSKPEEHYMTFLAPYGDWKTDGTFIVINQVRRKRLSQKSNKTITKQTI